MPTTANLALPYPALTAAPNIPADIQALAEAEDTVHGPAWTAYTPALTSSGTAPNLGTGPVASGRYRKVGKTVQFVFSLRFGTSPTVGTGTYFVSLPVAASAAWDTGGSNGRDIGSGTVTDDSAGISHLTVIRLVSTTTVMLVPNAAFGVTPTAPFTFATADFFRGQGTYEAAA